MNLVAWAIKWGVPIDAVEELRAGWNVATVPTHEGVAGESEAAATRRVRMEAAKKGARLFRNNVGAGYLDDGSFIRWGLANESREMNQVCKSSDLIGIKPVTVSQSDIGRRLGVFCAREIKAPGWQYAGTDRERAQLAFLQLVTSFGGDACFAVGEGTF